jgi:hypothetical protein
MNLYCIAITNVHPLQCVTVTDCAKYADDCAEYLKRRAPDRADSVEVRGVTDFYPPGYTNADSAWGRMLDDFQTARRVAESFRHLMRRTPGADPLPLMGRAWGAAMGSGYKLTNPRQGLYDSACEIAGVSQ